MYIVLMVLWRSQGCTQTMRDVSKGGRHRLIVIATLKLFGILGDFHIFSSSFVGVIAFRVVHIKVWAFQRRRKKR